MIDDEYPDVSWRASASCSQTDPELFFPEKGQSGGRAKVVCAGCSVRVECLEYALETNQRHVVWGGLSELERRGIRESRVGEEVA